MKKIKCKICNREFRNFIGLGQHLKTHKISSKDYYDKYLKQDGEDICYCGKEIKFYSLGSGYFKTCSNSCSHKGKKLKPFSQEHKDNISKGKKGQKLSQEHKDKISLSISGDKNWNWKGGISCEPYCPEFTHEYKEYIRERDNNKCQNPDCWKKPYKRLLDVHHIDYDKKNCSPDNLITLCNSCNARANKNREWHTKFYQNIINSKEK